MSPQTVTAAECELFTCETWRRLLPAIYAKIGELACCAGKSYELDGETIDAAAGMKALTDLAEWITMLCMKEAETFHGSAAVVGNCCGNGGCCA